MTIRATPSETVRLRAVYTINGNPAVVNPAPTVWLVTPAGVESSPGSATLRNSGGNVPVYDYDFSSATEGTHQVIFETTDANADAALFAEDIIVSEDGELTAAQVWTYATRTLTSTGLVTVVSNVDQDGDLTAIVGDSYTVARNNAFEWTNAAFADFGISSASTLTFKMQQGATLFEYPVTAASTTKLTMSLTSAQTTAWAAGRYKYQIDGVWAGAPTNKVTLVDAEIVISPRIG